MSALSNEQKRYLAQLAERLFKLTAAQARGRGVAPIPASSAPDLQTALVMLALEGSAKSEAEFRHQHVAQACGKAGLRCCSQLDYKTVEGHFLNLLGQPGKAMTAHVKAASEPRRQAEAVLVEACRRWGFNIGYAANLCQRIHKVNLDEANPGVIWKLVYTINNRGRAKQAKNN